VVVLEELDAVLERPLFVGRVEHEELEVFPPLRGALRADDFAREVERMELPFREPGLYEFRLFVRMLRDPNGAVVHHRRQLLGTEPLLMEAHP
jgi:hypothetical protein